MLALAAALALPTGLDRRDLAALGDALERTVERAALPLAIARLAAQPPDAALAVPVDGLGAARIADTFGAPRPGGRRHHGQDLFAPRGTPVRAAADGFVVRMGENPLGGRSVWTVGAGGRRYYYAHLDEYAPNLATGDRVAAGVTLLGRVGTSGNARGTPPHLHFGVYGAAGAIDPLPLLRAGPPINRSGRDLAAGAAHDVMARSRP